MHNYRLGICDYFVFTLRYTGIGGFLPDDSTSPLVSTFIIIYELWIMINGVNVLERLFEELLIFRNSKNVCQNIIIPSRWWVRHFGILDSQWFLASHVALPYCLFIFKKAYPVYTVLGLVHVMSSFVSWAGKTNTNLLHIYQTFLKI